MGIEMISFGVITGGIVLYLIYALIYPEKF